MENNPPNNTVREFINICQKIAFVHLCRKAAKGRLHPELRFDRITDIAIDCIADLFQRDESNNLVQIQAYFNSITFREMDEEELLAHLTRLALSKTNHRLFKVYNELDPLLGKILRNIKLAIQALHNFVETERLGEICIVPAMCEALEHLPCLDRPDIERILWQSMGGDESVPSLLAQLSLFLRKQENNSRVLPIMTVAFAIRTIYCNHEIMIQSEPVIYDKLLLSDIEAITKDICRNLKQKTEKKYVGEKGVTPELYEGYFIVIQEHLRLKITGRDGRDHSFFEQLKQACPCLTKDEYRKFHRAKIEYLAGLAYKEAVKRFKEEIN